MKVHLRVFVEFENLGKTINALTEAGISGFYILEYKGMSPQDWEGFYIKEDPKSALEMIRHHAKDAVLVCSVVDKDKVEEIEKSVMETLKNEKFTILEVPINKIIVNYGKREETKKEADVWELEKDVKCYYCGEEAPQRIRIDLNRAKIWCTNCGASRYYVIRTTE